MGEAYPGSTGGEIFNCYEDGTAPVIGSIMRNQAAGYYSTASGVSNMANGDISWVAGFGNTVYDTSTPHLVYGHMVLGGNNTITPSSSNDSRSCTIGFYNTTTGGNHNCVFGVINSTESKEDYLIGGGNKNYGSKGSNFLCGLNNVIPNTNKRSGTYLFGQNLHISKSESGPQHLVVVGKGSNTNINVPSTKSSLGAAITGGGSTNFNIECYPTYTKLDLPLRLPTDETQVNAIDPPQDPSNPTTNEQILATLGSLHNLGITRLEQHYLSVMPDLNTGTGRNITTDLGLTVPDWANEIILHIKIVDVDNFDSPITRRCNVSIPVQPADISTTWRGYLNIFHIAIKNSIYSTVYYAGEFYIYQNVLDLEKATELKLSEATPPTISFTRSRSGFILEGMDFKGIY